MRRFASRAALLAALAFLALPAAAQDDRDAKGLKVGEPVKELKLKLLDGKEFNVQSMKKGQIVVLNFWGAT